MDFLQAFPVAIIDEDYDGKRAAGRGMRQLAAAIEQEGFRVVADLSYDDARRLVNVANNESCWLVSVDGIEAEQTRWQILEQVLLAKRRRNDRLPIFLFGDEVTAEMVPSSVLKHANAFMRLFEDSFEFMARAIARSARLYLDRLPPPMFKALMDYTLQASYSWHTPGHGGGVAFRKSPVGQLFYHFSARTRCGPTSPCRLARSVRCSIILARSRQVSEMRRASSAPTKPYSSSAAPPQRTRSSGMAR
jgi:arginine decarboxylase